MRKRISAFGLACAVFLTACSSGKEKSGEGGGRKEINGVFLKNIKTIEAVMSNQNEELTLTGKVEYDPDKVINYVSLVNGIVDRAYISLGDKVRKGQALVDLRSSDLSALQSGLIASESEMKTARRELVTAQSMYDDKMLSEAQLFEAQSRFEQSQAAYVKAQNDISLHGVSKGNGVFMIASPMNGHIVSKNVLSGSAVFADGEPLFTVADLSTVWITAKVYAGNLTSVKEGMPVSITSLSYPGEVFEGKINTLSQVFDPEEKVLKARIFMANADLKLKPEMTVVVRLKNQTREPFVTVPSDVLIFDDNRYFVVVRESVDVFRTKEVKLQGQNNGVTHIASGLSEGEQVVSRDQLLIYFGLKEN